MKAEKFGFEELNRPVSWRLKISTVACTEVSALNSDIVTVGL
jgi:hypothetical protein